MFKPIEPPKPGDDVLLLWKTVAACVRAINALAKLKISFTGRAAFKLDETNAVLELPLSGGTLAPVRKPWQPYAAPYLGQGSPPADQGRRLRIQPGQVQDVGAANKEPANRNVEILVPPDCTDGYEVWLHATTNATGRIVGLAFDAGGVTPSAPDPTPGVLPSVAYYRLFRVFSDATRITDFSHVFADSLLTLLPTVIDVAALTTTRTLAWSPRGGNYIDT